jgi:hypothetical protein
MEARSSAGYVQPLTSISGFEADQICKDRRACCGRHQPASIGPAAAFTAPLLGVIYTQRGKQNREQVFDA